MYNVNNYAGFWKRFVAYLIDEVIMGIIGIVFLVPLLFLVFVTAFHDGEYEKYVYSSVDLGDKFSRYISPTEFIIILSAILIFVLLMTIIKWLYYALMESSAKQATLGKMVLNLTVTDMEGRRVTFMRATGRYFGKIISGLILSIGFIMAAFTEKKQTLHDILAGCLITDGSKILFSTSTIDSGLENEKV